MAWGAVLVRVIYPLASARFGIPSGIYPGGRRTPTAAGAKMGRDAGRRHGVAGRSGGMARAPGGGGGGRGASVRSERAEDTRTERAEPGRPGWTVGFVARLVLVAILLWAVANALWLGREVVFVAFFGVLVASFLSIFVDFLHDRLLLPRGVAAPLVLLAFVGVLVGLFYLAWPSLSEQIGQLRSTLPKSVDAVSGWLQEEYDRLTGTFGTPNPQMAAQLRLRLNTEAANLLSGALPLLNTVIGGVFGLLIVVASGLYMAVEPGAYMRGVLRLVPAHVRPRTEHALQSAGVTLRHWMLGAATAMLIVGTMEGIGLWVIGVPAALALAVITGLLEFIPIWGPVLSAVPAGLVALIISPAKLVWVLLLHTGIQQVEAHVIHPLVMREAVKLPPALTVTFQALMAVLFGFMGLLLGVPVLAALYVIVRELYVEDVADEQRAVTVETA